MQGTSTARPSASWILPPWSLFILSGDGCSLGVVEQAIQHTVKTAKDVRHSRTSSPPTSTTEQGTPSTNPDLKKDVSPQRKKADPPKSTVPAHLQAGAASRADEAEPRSPPLATRSFTPCARKHLFIASGASSRFSRQGWQGLAIERDDALRR